MERKLKLRFSLTNVVPVKVRVLFPPPRGGVAQRAEAATIKLRLSLQFQHSPPNARSTGYGR